MKFTNLLCFFAFLESIINGRSDFIAEVINDKEETLDGNNTKNNEQIDGKSGMC